MSSTAARIREMQSRETDKDFDEFKERVYQRSKKSILDEIAQLRNDTHPGYNEKVVRLKKDHDYTLRVNARHNDLEMMSIEEELARTKTRIEADLKNSISKLENSLRHELESYKRELIDGQKNRSDPQRQITEDIAVPRNTRSIADRKRRRLLVDSGPIEPVITTRSYTASSGANKKRSRKTSKDAVPQLRLPRIASKSGQAAERISTWESDHDLRMMNKHISNSRGRRPPVKLGDGEDHK